jgi:hypothetical protein
VEKDYTAFSFLRNVIRLEHFGRILICLGGGFDVIQIIVIRESNCVDEVVLARV